MTWHDAAACLHACQLGPGSSGRVCTATYCDYVLVPLCQQDYYDKKEKEAKAKKAAEAAAAEAAPADKKKK